MLDLRIHTNGVQLDEELCELFLAERVSRSASRSTATGPPMTCTAGTPTGAAATTRCCAPSPCCARSATGRSTRGCCATVDVRSDPVAVYRALAALDPPSLDFLLPHGTWDSPPPGAGEPA